MVTVQQGRHVHVLSIGVAEHDDGGQGAAGETCQASRSEATRKGIAWVVKLTLRAGLQPQSLNVTEARSRRGVGLEDMIETPGASSMIHAAGLQPSSSRAAPP